MSTRATVWLKVLLAGGAVLAVALLVQTAINYQYVSTSLIQQDARRVAEERVRNVERSARLSRPDDAAAFRLLLDDIRADWPEQVAAIVLLSSEGTSLAASGQAPDLSAYATPQPDQAATVRSRVMARDRMNGRTVFAGVFPCRCSFQRRTGAQPPAQEARNLRLYVALYEDSLSAPFARLRRNATISASAALALLLALALIAVRAGGYVRGKQLEAQMQVAREVQRDLLPAATAIPAGVDAAAVCRPASQIGGDFYDIGGLPGGGITLVIGDVSGHGVSAALLMGLTHGVMSHSPWSEAEDPAREAARLNSVLLVKSSGERYTSLFWCAYHPSSRSLRYLNAGHLAPVLIRRATGAVERLSEGGPVLGLLPAATYRTVETAAEPGDLLVLFSDGITEVPNDRDEQFGEEKLIAELQSNPRATSQELCDSILAAVSAFAGGRQAADDQTLVVVRLPGPA